MNHQKEISRLAYELTYHRYLLNRDKSASLFSELTVAEYIALHSIAKAAEEREQTFLKDLAQKLEMPIPATSRMVSKLKDRGFVLWSHDGDGSNGTYVSITASGKKAMEQQDELLNAYYRRVIEAFGEEEMVHLLRKMERLEEIMDEAFVEGGMDVGFDTAE